MCAVCAGALQHWLTITRELSSKLLVLDGPLTLWYSQGPVPLPARLFDVTVTATVLNECYKQMQAATSLASGTIADVNTAHLALLIRVYANACVSPLLCLSNHSETTLSMSGLQTVKYA